MLPFYLLYPYEAVGSGRTSIGILGCPRALGNSTQAQLGLFKTRSITFCAELMPFSRISAYAVCHPDFLASARPTQVSGQSRCR